MRWTRLALDDLARAHAYIANDGPTAANDAMERIGQTAALLTRHTHLGRPGRVAETRELVVAGTSFVIAYRIQDDRLEILAVIHAARRWPDSL